MFHWTRWWLANQTIGFTLIKPYWTLVFVGGYVGVGGFTGHEPMNCQGHQCLKHKMLQVIMHTSSSVCFFQEMGVLVLRNPKNKPVGSVGRYIGVQEVPSYRTKHGKRLLQYSLCIAFTRMHAYSWPAWRQVCMYMRIMVTPHKINMEPENTPIGKGKSSSKPSFSGSSCYSSGVYLCFF